MPSESRRKTEYVGVPVQQALVFRLLLHWLSFLCLSIVLGAMIQIFRDPTNAFNVGWSRLFTSQALSLIAAAVLMPIFIRDILRFSLRFAGPVVRLHRAIQRVLEGQDFTPLHFRKADYWHSLAADFNRLLSGRKVSAPLED